MKSGWFAPLLLILSFSAQSTIVSTTIGYAVTFVFLITVSIYLLTINPTKIYTTPQEQIAFLTIIFAYFATLVRTPSLAILQRIFAFTTVTYILLFFLPQVTDRRVVWYRFSALTASIVLVTSPTLFVDSLYFGPISFSPWHTTTTIPLLGLEVNTIRAVFINPNTLSQVACLASLSLLEFVNERDPISTALFAVNASAVYFAGSRSAMLALGIGIMLFLVYKVSGKDGVIAVSVAGAIVGFFGLLLFLLGRGPMTIDFSGRIGLWKASIDAIRDQPLLGHGPTVLGDVLSAYTEGNAKSPHNSFLKVFVSGGLVAGLAYIYIYIRAIKRLLPFVDHPDAIVVYVLLVATIVISMFEAPSIFGVSTISMCFALVLGYALKYRLHNPPEEIVQ